MKAKCINKECINYDIVIDTDNLLNLEFSEEFGKFVLDNKCTECNRNSLVIVNNINLKETSFINSGATKQMRSDKNTIY